MNLKSLFLLLCALALAPASLVAQGQETGHVSGKLLTREGVPMTGGLVYFFAGEGPIPNPEEYWRVPDFVAEIKAQGDFSVELPEGEYYIGAIKRASGKTDNGPPSPGDMFYRSLEGNGLPKRHGVKKGENIEFGSIAEAVPFKGLSGSKKISAISGRILKKNGKPVAGALVFAFQSEAMIGKPLFASYRTGKDGKYTLRVSEGGNYYLRVRDIYGGGPPAPGAVMGVFGGATAKAVAVKQGKIAKGIDITVDIFEGKGP